MLNTIKYTFLLSLSSLLLQCNSTNSEAFKDPFEGQMQAIPAGTFDMGCTEADGKCQEKEMPVHKVSIAAFQMAKFEVTQAQWKYVMGGSPSFFKNCDECPIEWVTRSQVDAFLFKMKEKTGKSYRLPTEAEWEYAARGGGSTSSPTEKYKYSGSENLEDVAWYKGNSAQKTQPVGKKKPNKFGLYDMSGNVSEWCLDYYASDFYTKKEATNPINQEISKYYIMRGGSWLSGDGACRCAWRGWVSGESNNYDLGFRVVL